MDIRSGHPYFRMTGGIPHLYPALQRSQAVEVLIVGGGITGALCAYQCAKAGLRVMVIERASIGGGSTSASTALLQYEIDTPMRELARTIGEDGAALAYRSCLNAVHGVVSLAESLDVIVQKRSSIQFASTNRHVKRLEREVAIRQKHGLPAQVLKGDALRALLPFAPPAALFTEEAGEVDPYLLTHALMQASIALGADVYDRTAMAEHARHTSTHLVRTDDGHIISATNVIDCRGYEAAAETREKGISLHSTFAIASERIECDELWHDDVLIWETATPYIYLRTTADRRAIIGGMDSTFRNPTARDALMPKRCAALEKKFCDLFPTLPFRTEFRWCGTFGATADGLPYIDVHPETGCWYVLGMGGNGITFSFIGAMLIRDALTGTLAPESHLYRFGR